MDEILVNGSTMGDQESVRASPALAARNSSSVWADRQTNDIKAQLLGVDGIPHGGDVEFVVNFPQKPGTKRQLPTVIETAQGFAVSWIEQRPGGKPQVMLRAFDLDTHVGPGERRSAPRRSNRSYGR